MIALIEYRKIFHQNLNIHNFKQSTNEFNFALSKSMRAAEQSALLAVDRR